MPFADAEVLIEVVGDRVPGHVPAHPILEPRDFVLRSARGEGERRVAGVQMGDVGNLVGDHRAADARVLGPALHSGLEEGAVEDELAASVEEVAEGRGAVRSFELVLLLHLEPRHAPPFGCNGVARLRQRLLLDEQSLPRSFPLVAGHDRGCVHRESPLWASRPEVPRDGRLEPRKFWASSASTHLGEGRGRSGRADTRLGGSSLFPASVSDCVRARGRRAECTR